MMFENIALSYADVLTPHKQLPLVRINSTCVFCRCALMVPTVAYCSAKWLAVVSLPGLNDKTHMNE